MPFSRLERRRIDRAARVKLGLLGTKGDYQDFMDDCMADLLDSGEAEDQDDAEEQCQILWQDEE